jgi:hypothetical protein
VDVNLELQWLMISRAHLDAMLPWRQYQPLRVPIERFHRADVGVVDINRGDG